MITIGRTTVAADGSTLVQGPETSFVSVYSGAFVGFYGTYTATKIETLGFLVASNTARCQAEGSAGG